MRRPQSAQEWVLSNGLGAAVLDAFLPPNESVKHQTAPGGDACILQHLFVSTAWRLVSSGFELPQVSLGWLILGMFGCCAVRAVYASLQLSLG